MNQRLSVDMGSQDRAVLPPTFPQRAARPELGERGDAERGVRHDALVVQEGNRRFPHGCGERSFHRRTSMLMM